MSPKAESIITESAAALAEKAKPLHVAKSPFEQLCNLALAAAEVWLRALAADAAEWSKK